MNAIRAFIAVHPPDEVKHALAQISRELSQTVPDGAVRWVKPERIHLTLRFLGETKLDQLSAISAGIDRVGLAHHQMALHLDGVGCFPNRRRPRIIWVGLRGDVAGLRALKAAVDDVLAPLGWERETRPFQAHLTIGRVQNVRKLKEVRWEAAVPIVALPIPSIHLVESQLRPGGPLYTDRHTSLLRSA